VESPSGQKEIFYNRAGDMGSKHSFLDQFNHHFEKINEALDQNFSTRIPLMHNIGHHSLLGEGKRLRPLLFVLASELCGYQGADVYKLSTIFEYIHTASLLHDDVLDNADLRRKKPSANHLWGSSAAILCGDFFYSKASDMAVDYKNFQFMKMLANTTLMMTEGQIMELANTHNWRIKKEEYMEIITAKTAILLSSTCACAAIAAGAENKKIHEMKTFGMDLGIAFQLVDDILDYTSCVEEFGKPVGKDLKEGKITLPLIYTLSKFENDEIQRLEEQFKNQNATEEDYEKMIEKVRNNGVLEQIRSEAEDYVDNASRVISVYPESPAKNQLLSLNTYLIRRHF
jgi:octaprenyl-diphosphate synthase